MMSDLLERLEPAEPCAEAAPEGDGWLAECEKMLLTMHQRGDGYAAWGWTLDYAGRLIAAAKERDELRSKVAELTAERDEALVDAVPTRRLRQAIESLDGSALWLSQKDFIAALLASPQPSPRHKRAKGPRSKPNELRARIRDEAVLVAKVWNEVNGECAMAYRLDGMTACGYAYCSKEDTFDAYSGMSRANRRAFDALEDGLRQKATLGTKAYHSGELRSTEMDLPLWSWSDDRKAGKAP